MRRLRIYCLERRARRLLMHYAAAVESLGITAEDVRRMCPSLLRTARAGKAAAVRALRLRGRDVRHLRTPPEDEGFPKRGPQRAMSCFCGHCGWWFDFPSRGCPCRDRRSPQHRRFDERLLAAVGPKFRAWLERERRNPFDE